VPILIHTADVHLGAPLGWLGPKASEQRAQLRLTLGTVVDLARDHGAALLLVAGDLFDSGTPPASEVRFAAGEFGRLTSTSDASVVILPGSHDHLAAGSVYETHREVFEGLDRVTVLGARGETSVGFARAGIAVHGAAPRANRSTVRQLASLEPDGSFTFNVAMAHGSADVAPAAADDHPIGTAELAAPGWSYFALGHWHSWRRIDAGAAPAVYPGAPEVIAVDQTGAGHVAKVDLDPGGVRVERLRIGARTIAHAAIDVSEAVDARSAEELVAARVPPDPSVVLRLTLRGLVEIGATFDEEALVASLGERYFHVAVGERNVHVRLGREELARIPSQFVVGRFVRLMAARMDAADDEADRAEIEDAVQLGVALLQGKDVLG